MCEARPQTALAIQGLVAGYGQGVVLDGLSLTVEAGEAVALVGRNGAGKTTLLKAVMGLVGARAGSIAFAGRRVERLEPFERARLGVGYVPQGREVFAELTVEQNLILGNLAATTAAEAYEVFPALADKRDRPAGGLSGGQQQLVAVARALMSRPRLLLLDEPSEGIQPSIVAEIAETLSSLARARGMAMLLVEQNIDMALSMTSRVVFVEQGRAVGSEPSAALAQDPSRIEARLSL
jgi:urea ABC transporter ATP-binding protein UrtE